LRVRKLFACYPGIPTLTQKTVKSVDADFRVAAIAVAAIAVAVTAGDQSTAIGKEKVDQK
jgi:hypothetical protein